MFNNGKVNANAQKNLIKQKIISFPRKTNESLNSNKAHLFIRKDSLPLRFLEDEPES